MNIRLTRAVLVLFANAVHVNGECAAPPDGKGATINYNNETIIVTPDANGVVIIPSDWTFVPKHAFMFCYDLKKIETPAVIKKIHSYAFYQSGLTELLFGADSRLETIGAVAFFGTNITSVVIPESVTEILNEAFSYSALETISFGSTNGSQLETIGTAAFRYTRIKSVVVPKSITELSHSAFSPSELMEISFEEDSRLETIGRFAFGSTKLTSVVIPRSVTDILGYAFYKSQLEEVTFQSGSRLKTIGRFAFKRNTKLRSINVPPNVTIDINAFEETGCGYDVNMFVAGKEVCNCNQCSSTPSSILSSIPTAMLTTSAPITLAPTTYVPTTSLPTNSSPTKSRIANGHGKVPLGPPTSVPKTLAPTKGGGNAKGGGGGGKNRGDGGIGTRPSFSSTPECNNIQKFRAYDKVYKDFITCLDLQSIKWKFRRNVCERVVTYQDETNKINLFCPETCRYDCTQPEKPRQILFQ